MAVYRRGYQRYRGPLTGRWARVMALPRFAWERLFQQRLVVILLVVALVWPLLCAAFIYISNRAELLAGLEPGFTRFLQVDGKFFLVFMNFQSIFALLMAALAGPGLIAPDLANNALPLYFSRPLSRTDYVLARLLTLVGLLSLITWLPGLALFSLQTGMAGWKWFSLYWRLSVGIFGGFLIWIVIVSLVALASSAYVKWKMVAGALVLGFFFVLAGAGEIVNAVFRLPGGSMVNPAVAMNRIWFEMMGLDSPLTVDLPGCVATLAILTVGLILVLERKLRPVEVIS